MLPMRHGYTNTTTGDGRIVVKRYTGFDAADRQATEERALRRLAGLLPVPRLIAAGHGSVTMEFRPGRHGQELITEGRAAAVLRSCGTMLHLLQRTVPGLVHGDYGPNNTLHQPQTGAVTAIVDWEWAHRGDPVEDLAWAEWIVRTHHPDHIDALDALFEGYGSRPAFELRRAAALARCREMRDRPGANPRWVEHVRATAAWRE